MRRLHFEENGESGMNEDDGKVVSFQMLRIERNHRKICTCNPPSYEIDTQNRIIVCKKCNAVIDSFEAIQRIAEYTEMLENYQKEAIEEAKRHRELADSEFKRRMKYHAFRNMDKQYQNNMLPVCPICHKIFEPMRITEYINRKYTDFGDKE